MSQLHFRFKAQTATAEQVPIPPGDSRDYDAASQAPSSQSGSSQPSQRSEAEPACLHLLIWPEDSGHKEGSLPG